MRSKVLFLVPFGCHIFNELTNVIQFMLLTLKKKKKWEHEGAQQLQWRNTEAAVDAGGL